MQQIFFLIFSKLHSIIQTRPHVRLKTGCLAGPNLDEALNLFANGRSATRGQVRSSGI